MSASEGAVQSSVDDLEASSLVVRAAVGAVATVLTAVVVLALPLLAPQIGVAATVSAITLAVVGLLVFTLLKGRHDSAPALHG
jgi:hypothetical protein